MKIIYRTNFIPETKDIIELFNHSGYFPIADKNDTARITKMFHNSNIIITAWHEDVLVGIARSLCDFSYCCYLSDLCVRDTVKKNGIGKELIRLTKEMAGKECKLLLHSSSTAIDFYRKIGMQQIDTVFIIQRDY
jgi:GNAT superfamily N-acetyltransferase